MKTGRQQVELIALYQELGSYRAVAEIAGCDHKTVKRYVEAAGSLGQKATPVRRRRETDPYEELIRDRIAQTKAKITTPRLHRLLVAAGYPGSERALRRTVAEEKERYRKREAIAGRVYRPWVSAPGEWLLCDWGSAGQVPTAAGPRPLSFFSAVLGHSRFRVVSFSCLQSFPALACGLAHAFEAIGGVPARVLFDNPKTITAGFCADAAVLNPELVRLASHYRFAPATTERADPESKGKVEALVRFTKSDLIPYEGYGSLDEASASAAAWCAEVNARPHGETRRPPVEALADEAPLLRPLPAERPSIACGAPRKVDRLATVRLWHARYSVPHRLVGEVVELQASDRDVVVLHQGVPVAHHPLMGPGSSSIDDAHYPTPRPTGVRPLRARSATEASFLALGPEAERYLRAAARAGTTRLKERLEEALVLARSRGEAAARGALERASEFGRYERGDLASICDGLAGPPPSQSFEAEPLELAGLPRVPTRPLAAYAEAGR